MKQKKIIWFLCPNIHAAEFENSRSKTQNLNRILDRIKFSQSKLLYALFLYVHQQ